MLLVVQKKICMLLLATLAFTASSVAQNNISGTVKDKDGQPLAAVSVTVKGTNKGTSTNANGDFSLTNVKDGATLVISGTGYGSQQIKVRGSDPIMVALETSVGNLNEVVVIGYGTRKVKDATGSVAALSQKDFNKGVISTPEQLLQGRTPGVTVSPASGEPGAASTINIRGTSSIRGNNDPLYVVDGVPLSGGGTSGTSSGVEGSSTAKNPLMFLNPNDIESISILKDASSAAIYGSRGANGVIIITTKSGRGAKGSFSFSAATSISEVASRYDLLKPVDFLAAVRQANIDAGTSPDAANLAIKLVDKKASTDWQDQIFRTGISQNYNLSWGFSRKSTAIRLSGSYDDQEGIITA